MCSTCRKEETLAFTLLYNEMIEIKELLQRQKPSPDMIEVTNEWKGPYPDT